MDDITPVLDIDSLDQMFDIAEFVSGTLSLTHEGRLIVYGIKEDIANLAEDINKIGSGFAYIVEVLADDTLGFRL